MIENNLYKTIEELETIYPFLNVKIEVKKELRDIIREYDVSVGDSLLAKTSALGSESSLRRMLIRSSKYPKGKDPLFRVAAITETGKIITRDDMIKKTPTAWGSPTIGLE